MAPRRKQPKALKVLHPKSERETRSMIVGSKGEQTAEKANPWMGSPEIEKKEWLCMWRIIDTASKANIWDQDDGMMAAVAALLNTNEARKLHLTRHPNFGQRHLTPFISVTPNYVLMWDGRRSWYVKRASGKPSSTVYFVQMNIKARIANGGCILNARDQLNHYDPNGDHGDYDWDVYDDEYLLTFQAHADEIVWKWKVADIEDWLDDHDCGIEQWWEQVGKVVYEIHENARQDEMNAQQCRREVNRWLQVNFPVAALIIGDDE